MRLPILIQNMFFLAFRQLHKKQDMMVLAHLLHVPEIWGSTPGIVGEFINFKKCPRQLPNQPKLYCEITLFSFQFRIVPCTLPQVSSLSFQKVYKDFFAVQLLT